MDNVGQGVATVWFLPRGRHARGKHWVRDRTGPRGKAPVAWQLKLTHFVDDHLDVLRDIGRHFSNHGGGSAALVPCAHHVVG